MAEGIAKLDYKGGIAGGEKPPLDVGIRLRLSVMMFLQFAVWGSWFTVWNVYLKAAVVDGGLGFTGGQIGNLYGTMALGAILSMMLAGQLADRVLSSEYLMAIFHLAGAFLLYKMAVTHDYNTLWWISLAYALVYNPTLSISNSLAFSHIPDATRDFPSLRVLGTIGWIAAGLGVSFLLPAHSQSTNRPLLMAAVLSAGLGLFSLALPHTPPSGKTAGSLPFLRAFKLLLNPSFGIFFAISFVITIALAFYYTFAGTFLDSVGVKDIAAVMTIGQGSEIGFMLLLPFALKRFGMKGVLSLGMAAWAVRYLFFSIGHPYLLIILAVALHGVCFDFFLAAGFIYTDNKAPSAIRGSAQALFSFLTYGVGMWIGNLVSGQVVDYFTVGAATQWSKVWMAPAIGAVACLALFLLLWKDTPGKVEEIEASSLVAEPLV
ncbi:MAG TPA: MFS transporter [Tepidisphaeraceae bacterium]|jgi:nucleoside transporter|nr:MFS transporter [Tepidisphaeraceae bacterium]